MCEGNGGRVSPPEGPVGANEYHEPQPPVRRRIRYDVEEEEIGWDVVPPMMSIGSNATDWKEVNASTEGGRLQYRKSLQHLGTFVVPDTFGANDCASSPSSQSVPQLRPPTSISTKPILLVADDGVSYYLVAGCQDGTICLWNMMQLPALKAFLEHNKRQHSFAKPHSGKKDGDDTVAKDDILSSNPPDPLHCIDTLTSVQPLQVVATANSESRDRKTATIVQLCQRPHDIVSSGRSFVAMNMLGVVYIVSVSEKATLKLRASFETGRLSPTCISYINDSTIAVGYQSGFLEAWSVQKVFDDAEESTSSPIETQRSKIDSSPHPGSGFFTLLWRATFADYESAPLPSITCIAPLSSVGTAHLCDNVNTTTNADDASLFLERTDVPFYLALTLNHNVSMRRNTASMLEVVDSTSIANSWTKFLEENSSTISDEDAAVPLEAHCVLPEAGRDIMESSTIGRVDESRHRSTTHWIPSRGTNCLCSVPPSDSSTNQVAVGLADGMVTILDSRQCDDGRPQWGASRFVDQFCLSFPCIGMSCLNIADNHGSPAPYLAGCMRGSATYLIPLNSSQGGTDPTSIIVAMSVPHGFDDDASIRYVQEFAAFNLITSHFGEMMPTDSQLSVPTLVYVWPGGVIDIYSYGLLSCTHSLPDEQLIQELVSNGSVGLLRDVLLSSGSDDFELHEMWTGALEEVSRLERDVPIAAEDLYSERFACFRTVLLHFAQ
jgi:hypothetical protein